MGTWWRSEEMTYMSLIISEEAAPTVVRELGILGCLQFTDLSPDLTPFQRRYVSYVKRCDEIERKIRFLHGEAKKLGVRITPGGNVEDFVRNAHKNEQASGSYLLEGLETKLDKLEQQYLELNKYNAKLAEEYTSKVEYNELLLKVRKVAYVQAQLNNSDKEEHLHLESLHEAGSGHGVQLSPLLSAEHHIKVERGEKSSGEVMEFSNIAGTVKTADRTRFERMLFRATRGNCYVRFATIPDEVKDSNDKPLDKVIFWVFYKSSSIESKIQRICDAFGAKRYDVSEVQHPEALARIHQTNFKEMQEAKKILSISSDTRLKLTKEVAKDLEEWLWIVRREKGIYHTLNLFKMDIANGVLRARGWITNDLMDKAKRGIQRGHALANLTNNALFERVPEIWPSPPTHFVTNKYTYAFQEFVNTYGVPRYGEANPALFTAATFPFLFGVMYGDIGHGSILTMASTYLVLTEKKGEERGADEMVKSIYSARYMLLGMGICSVYAGLIYNDYFSIGLNLFGSSFAWFKYETGEKAQLKGDYGDPLNVYPFGVDPAWHVANNDLLFFNSMKMKMSVILGIIQMIWGVCLKGANASFYKSKLDLFTEFVPQFIFAVGFFGYMVVLIFVKWSINWDNRMKLGSCNYDINGNFGKCSLTPSAAVPLPSCYNMLGKACTANSLLSDVCTLGYGGTSGGCQPPNLITTLINIALKPGSVDEPMYSGQGGVQTILLLLAFISVPWMLCCKPCYLRSENNKHEKHKKEHKAVTSHTANPLLEGVEAGHANPHEGHGAGAHHTEEHHEYPPGFQGGHGPHDGGHGHGEFNFGEIMIHQAIETIEFVLGMVSNTASYLRLWALSLAHTELATVFWEKAMLAGLSTNSPIGVVVVRLGFSHFLSIAFNFSPSHFCSSQHSPPLSLSPSGLLHLRDGDLRRAACHGRARVLPPRSAPALGGVPKQVFQS